MNTQIDEFLKDVIQVEPDTKNVDWPDAIRLEMIERSSFYNNPMIYQYGYYDGYQKAISIIKNTHI